MTDPWSVLALLPFAHIADGHIGPIPLHPFGLLVAIGVVVGHRFASRRALVLGLDAQRFDDLVFTTVGVGFVLSHVFDAIAYHPELVRAHPIELIMIHHGLSSFGGFLGAAIGFAFYARRHRIDTWRYADAIAYGLPFGWLFGRAGCALVHDHPGLASHSIFAVNWPGGPRFDLGLLEMLCTPLLIAAVVLVGRRTKRPGTVVATLALLYPWIRFPLDFLRVPDPQGGDVRYGYFTPNKKSAIDAY